MPDVTFVKGYGFPRGSKMDYAGMGSFGGGFGALSLPEADLFDTIPALDGYQGHDGHLGDTTLPQLDLSQGAPPVGQQPGWGGGAPSPMGVLPLLGIALIGWALFSK